MIEESFDAWEKYEELRNSPEWEKRRNDAKIGRKYNLKFEGSQYRIYNPDFYGMFYFEGASNYAKDYKEGFLEGLKTLKEDEEITLTSLRDPHLREQTKKDLQEILFSRNFKNANKGLLHKVTLMNPLLWSHESIKYLGFCNGFMQSIEDLISRTDFTLEDLKPNKPTINNKEEKIFAKHYALAYFFELRALNKEFPTSKNDIENLSYSRAYPIAPNTFYKNFNKIVETKSLENSITLINVFGENWKELVVKITKFKKEIEEYLQAKNL